MSGQSEAKYAAARLLQGGFSRRFYSKYGADGFICAAVLVCKTKCSKG
jgi:hypothetical protein